jgi:vacuolar-type H+-ATPase subunit I/STV1
MNTEHERPVVRPPTLPVVPAGKLWTSLLVPPLAVVLCGLLIGFIGDRSAKESMVLSIPLLAGALILGMSFVFSSAVGQRYRGNSFVFLIFSYIFGQIILGIALWFGSCLIALS